MSNKQAVTAVTVTNPIDPTRSRTVIVTGHVTKAHIDRAIQHLDDNTPTGLLPESTDQYHVAMRPYREIPALDTFSSGLVAWMDRGTEEIPGANIRR